MVAYISSTYSQIVFAQLRLLRIKLLEKKRVVLK